MGRIMTAYWVRAGLLLLALGVAACGGGGAAGAGVSVHDSAGLRIVENRRPAWGDERRWTVSSSPSVEIGAVEGAAEYQLGQVRGAVRLPDGTVVVADGTSRELRFFDPVGRFLRKAGRAGEGPGEFQGLDAVLPYRGDSIAAWDARQKRLSVFAADGTFVRAVTVREAGGLAPGIRGVFPDGSFVLEPSASLQGFLAMASGERRDSVAYVSVSPGGVLADTLAVQADREILASRQGAVIVHQSILFGRDSYFAAGQGRAYVGQSDAFRIDVVDGGGTRLMSIRRPLPPRHARREDVGRAREAALAERRDRDAQIARALGNAAPAPTESDLPSRPTIPAFDQLIVDAQDHLWVRDFVVDYSAPSRWFVFAPDGHWLGTVEVPAGLSVMQIGPDWLLGRGKDGLDVEYVRLYRLSRG
jgi:hypothetical protein